MDKIIKLKDESPLARGRSRLVFRHPDDPDLIIKVVRPEVIEDRFGNNTKWYKKRRRFGRFISYMREIQEFLAVQSSMDKSPHFLQRIVGFTQTDLGLGLVIEAVLDPNGQLAPTIFALIKSGQFDDQAKDALRSTLDQILHCNVIISDLNPGNLVYTSSPEHGHYFVLIDGLGNNSLIPSKIISSRLNQRSKRGRFDRLYSRIERNMLKNAPSDQTKE